MRASGRPHVLILWLRVSNGGQPVKFLMIFAPQSLFVVSVEFNGDCYEDEVKCGRPQFWGYYQCSNIKVVVSVCHNNKHIRFMA